MTKRGAEFTGVNEYTLMGESDAIQYLRAINDLHARKNALKAENDPALEALLEQKRIIDALISEKKTAKKDALAVVDGLIDDESEDLRDYIKDPHSPIEDFERSIFSLPSMGGEDLSNGQIREAVLLLAEQLAAFDEYLRQNSEPQPFMVVSYKPSQIPGWYSDLHINYGLTIPATGLSLQEKIQEQVCECGEIHRDPTNIIKLPVHVHDAIKPSVSLHEYFTSAHDVVSVNGYRSQLDAPNSAHFFREPKNSLILPTGKVFTEGAEPIVRYDYGDKIIEITASSKSLSPAQESTLCAVGTEAVWETRNELYDRAKKAYESNQYMREMYGNIDKLIVHGLRRGAASIKANRRPPLHS
jgi:small-conductance mechanosensitive channel